MIGKLLGALISLVVAVCVATVIAATALVFYYAQSWKVTKERAGQALAILQGKGLETLLPPPPPKKENDSEQPGYDQLLAAQGLKSRDLEQRELTLRANMRQFQEQLDKIDEERKRIAQVRDDLQSKLDEMQATATSAGMETVGATITTLKPKQAKELIQQLLDKGETDVVARMLTGMADGKRAKIIAEFKSREELEKIGAVLNRIREGEPTKELAGATAKKLQPPNGPGT
jgi:hypothetical protein